MKNKIAYIVLGLLVLAMVAAPFTGCTVPDEAATGHTLEEPDEICPDTLIEADEIAFLSSANLNGQPSQDDVVFPAETPVIYGVIKLSQDLCCTLVTVVWQKEQETVHYWSVENPAEIGVSFTVPFVRPEGGFSAGQYKVTVYIGIKELVSASFTVE